MWYLCLVTHRLVKPVVASWIINTFAMTLSFVTYWTSNDHSFVGGALNIASVGTIGSILVFGLVINRIDGVSIIYSTFQKWCFAITIVIGVIWAIMVFGFRGEGKIPNLLTQGLLVVGYAVLIIKVWKSEKNTESFVLWWGIFIGSLIGIKIGYLKGDFLSKCYAWRSTIMCGILLLVMSYKWQKSRTCTVESTYVPKGSEVF